MKLSSIFCMLVVMIVCTACAGKKVVTVPLAYAAVTNKVAQMRPAIGPGGKPRAVSSREEVAGAHFKHWLREPGGDVKLGPYTVVDVAKVNEATTTVQLKTGKHGFFGYRHFFFTERKRWKELQEILRQ